MFAGTPTPDPGRSRKAQEKLFHTQRRGQASSIGGWEKPAPSWPHLTSRRMQATAPQAASCQNREASGARGWGRARKQGSLFPQVQKKSDLQPAHFPGALEI